MAEEQKEGLSIHTHRDKIEDMAMQLTAAKGQIAELEDALKSVKE